MQEPRQLYGLGSIVKKAVRGVKKIAKSPIGKAALLYTGVAGLGALGAGSAGSGFGLGMLSPSAVARNVGMSLGRMGLGSKLIGPKQPGTSFLSKLNPFTNPNLSFGQKAFIGGGLGLAALPFLMGGGEEEVEEDVDVMDVGAVRDAARNYYRNPGAPTDLAFMPQKKYVMENFYAANGGRAGYADGMMVEEDDEEEFIRSGAGQRFRQPKAFLNMGGNAGQVQAEQMLMAEYVKYKNRGGDMSFEQFVKAVMQASEQPQGMGMEQPQPIAMAANGGRMSKQEGGIMETEEASEMIDMGGLEKDYRNEGGFVAMGGEERADDVPARLSKNEFVFTADAVRNAGGGDIDKGAEVMENLMNNLEQGGEVSEESQGLEEAQAMYDQMQQLESRII